MDDANTTEINRQEVIRKLDSILEKHFRNLDQISALGDDLSLNLASVASLHLIVEKEFEISEAEETERYDRKSFISDLTELGLEIDDDMINTFETLHDKGYMKIDPEGKYSAESVATKMVDNMNKMFPGMPGMNLVAYYIQTLDEILSGRKDFDKGESQFDQALEARGRALSFVFLKTEKKSAKQQAEDRVKKAVELKESRKASDRLKKIYGSKLSELRNSAINRVAEPSVLTKRALDSKEINVKEISPKKIKEAKKKAERERQEAERIERERLEKDEAELIRIEEERLETERLDQEKIELEKKKAEEEKLELERLENERKEQERLETERLENERKEEDRLAGEKLEAERIERERVEKELAIEAQIAAFEQEMASPCPICNVGKILPDKTAADKNFFKCSSEGCKFISWTKPYNFLCPVCRNPFLTEYEIPSGGFGLKCPRASCSYSQENIFDPTPVQQPVIQQGQAVPGAPKKKRKLVRRRKR